MTSWDYTPSHQQARLYHISQREADESMHMQELAGVGKTYLIRLMLEILPASSTLLLAFTGAQLAALRSRLSDLEVTEMTFRGMADELLTQDLTQPWRRVGDGRGNATYQLSDQTIASPSQGLALYSSSRVDDGIHVSL